jgi:3'(2'),5'-bisphosphate nucleotidase
MHDKELHIALKLARRAGTVAMRYYRRNVRVIMKANETPVTAADRWIEHMLVNGILEHFPNDRVVGEEHGFRHGRPGRFWVIDPIDGTKAFSRRQPGFGILIALVEHGRVVLGVAAAPARRKVYYAVRNHGAFVVSGKRKRRLRVSEKVVNFADATLGGPIDPEKSSPVSQLVRKMLKVHRRVPIGSAGMELCGVAEGSLDEAMLTAVHLGVWDVAAGQLIAEEAGAIVSDLGGRPFTYQWGRTSVRRGILAANSGLHADTIRVLRAKRIPEILEAHSRREQRHLAKG